jgi:hypothetical protein
MDELVLTLTRIFYSLYSFRTHSTQNGIGSEANVLNYRSVLYSNLKFSPISVVLLAPFSTRI